MRRDKKMGSNNLFKEQSANKIDRFASDLWNELEGLSEEELKEEAEKISNTNLSKTIDRLLKFPLKSKRVGFRITGEEIKDISRIPFSVLKSATLLSEKIVQSGRDSDIIFKDEKFDPNVSLKAGSLNVEIDLPTIENSKIDTGKEMEDKLKEINKDDLVIDDKNIKILEPIADLVNNSKVDCVEINIDGVKIDSIKGDRAKKIRKKLDDFKESRKKADEDVFEDYILIFATDTKDYKFRAMVKDKGILDFECDAKKTQKGTFFKALNSQVKDLDVKGRRLDKDAINEIIHNKSSNLVFIKGTYKNLKTVVIDYFSG